MGENYSRIRAKAAGAEILKMNNIARKIFFLTLFLFFSQKVLFSQGLTPEERVKLDRALYQNKGISETEEKGAEEGAQEEVTPEIIKKKLPVYSVNLKKLMEEAKKNIDRIARKKEAADVKQEKKIRGETIVKSKEKLQRDKELEIALEGLEQPKQKKKAAVVLAKPKPKPVKLVPLKPTPLKEEPKQAFPSLASPLVMDTLYKDATIYYNTGLFDDAKRVFKEILAIDPKETKAQEYLNKKIPAKEKQSLSK